MKAGALKAVGNFEELYSGLKLPLKISIALKGKDESLEGLLKQVGAADIGYEEGCLIASIQREDKLRILSAVMNRNGNVVDISIREPNLEEVFFGIH